MELEFYSLWLPVVNCGLPSLLIKEAGFFHYSIFQRKFDEEKCWSPGRKYNFELFDNTSYLLSEKKLLLILDILN